MCIRDRRIYSDSGASSSRRSNSGPNSRYRQTLHGIQTPRFGNRVNRGDQFRSRLGRVLPKERIVLRVPNQQINAQRLGTATEPEISMNWQPIETAPKDATVLIGDAGGVHVAFWWETTTGYSGWTVCGPAPQEQFNPTHWMPLPEPPE